MSHDIFFSYKHEDGYAAAKDLSNHLHLLQGYDVFADYEIIERRSGQFPDELEEEIIHCKDFILIVTEKAFGKTIFNDSDWVRQEIRMALRNLQNTNIIVVRVNGAKIPDTIPEDIKKIKDFTDITYYTEDYKATALEWISDNLISQPKYLNNRERIRESASIYSPDSEKEFDRLKIQACNSKPNDDYIIKKLSSPKMNVLDVGCAYGFVGKSRFADYDVNKVVGIDKNKKCIEYAIKNNDDNRFCYACIDIESDDFIEQIKTVMEDNHIERFDFVFISLVLHHLAKPIMFLGKIRPFIKDGGYIVIRGSDDGSKLSYGDNGLMDKIIAETQRIEGVSDRINGRKIYSWLFQTHYRDIRIESFMRDTTSVSYDMRADLFNESFSYRINYLTKLMEQNPDSNNNKLDFIRMEHLLAQFKEVFVYNDSFWYGEYDYIGYAKK